MNSSHKIYPYGIPVFALLLGNYQRIKKVVFSTQYSCYILIIENISTRSCSFFLDLQRDEIVDLEKLKEFSASVADYCKNLGYQDFETTLSYLNCVVIEQYSTCIPCIPKITLQA